jgi:hypothetical protein
MAVCQPYAPAVFYPQEDSWYSFLLEAIVRLEGLGKFKKKSSHLIGNRTRDLPTSISCATAQAVVFIVIRTGRGTKITSFLCDKVVLAEFYWHSGTVTQSVWLSTFKCRYSKGALSTEVKMWDLTLFKRPGKHWTPPNPMTSWKISLQRSVMQSQLRKYE